MATNERAKRKHLALPVSLHEKLVEVQKFTNAPTINDVFKDALRVYLALVKETRDGNEVVVNRKDGSQMSYAVFLD